MTDPIVIVGGGLAAQRCCERLRRSGWDGAIVMVCEEREAPYDRPPLSKAYLAGEMTDAPRLRPDEWYADNAVELVLGTRATGLRPKRRELELSDGTTLRYHRVLVATGAAPRTLDGAASFANMHTLRTLDDALRLRAALQPGTRVAVVGAGFIGQEVASTARSLGAEVVLVEALPVPLQHVLGAGVGGWFAQLHRDQGVEVHMGAPVARLIGNGRVDSVELGDGSHIACDEIVVGVGVAPATGWLSGSGLVNPARCNGTGPPLRADHAGRTAAPDVFAAGDCTGGQHWEAAVQQGGAAALAMLGHDPPASPPSSFWSDIYGIRVNWLGNSAGADDVVVDGDPQTRDFAVLYTRESRPVAGLLVGRPHGLPALRRLIHSGPHSKGATP